MRNNFSTLNFKSSTQKGFTLIELLVVIVIISVLATLMMVNFIGVRQRGRDAQRKADIRQLQTALELYRADIGSYPQIMPTCGALPGLVSGGTTYIKKIPCDPMGANQTYNSGAYYYSSPAPYDTYTLGSCLENENDIDGKPTSPGGTGCPAGKDYFIVENP